MLKLDIAKLCRICLEANTSLSSLFAKSTSFDGGILLADMISQCTNCNVCQEDEFPHNICNECMEQAHGAYKFKQLCEASHRTLTAYFASVKSNIEIDLEANALNNESLKTEDLTGVLSEPLIKSEHEATETKDVLETVAIKNEADASEGYFEGKSTAERTSFEYIQEDEIIIKDEIVSDVDNEDQCEEENSSKSSCSTSSKEQSEEDNASSNAKNQTNQESQKNAASELPSSRRRRTNKSSHATEKKKRHKCPDPDCDKSFTRAIYLRYHSRLHTGEKPYECDVCSKAFTRPETLKVHKRLHTGEKYYKCRDCKEAFFHSNSLALHIRKFHTDGKEVFQCKYCKRKFKTEESLKRHRKTFHSDEKPYKCEFCYEGFKHSSDLIAHKSVHDKPIDDKPYKCHVCGAAFRSEDNLDTHKRMHNLERPFKCKYCSVSFTHFGGLIPHEMWHTGEHYNKCDECQAAFTNSKSLAAHKRWHTPYKCEECSASFSHSDSLIEHKRSLKHGAAHVCPDCGCSYTSVQGLASHRSVMHTKTTYECGYCSKTFITSTHLNESEKPHMCPECSKAARLTTNKSLTDLRPFKCLDCNKSFSYYTTLSGHISRFHSKVKSSTK